MKHNERAEEKSACTDSHPEAGIGHQVSVASAMIACWPGSSELGACICKPEHHVSCMADCTEHGFNAKNRKHMIYYTAFVAAQKAQKDAVFANFDFT